MSLRGWEKLVCDNFVQRNTVTEILKEPCGSEEFIAVHKLTWHEGQGTANKQDAWKCAKCGAIASTAKMIDVVQKKHLQSKMDELKEQMGG